MARCTSAGPGKHITLNVVNTLVQKCRNNCNVRRDNGMRYGAYVEALTYLLLLSKVL